MGHHNVVFEFMRIFNRTEKVAKKPAYLWTAAVELEVATDLREYNYDTTEGRNECFRRVKVVDFSIILE